jgi:hypothetical protein
MSVFGGVVGKRTRDLTRESFFHCKRREALLFFNLPFHSRAAAAAPPPPAPFPAGAPGRRGTMPRSTSAAAMSIAVDFSGR